MEYLGYAETQMAALEKSGKIIVAKIGKRKFIQRVSIRKLIESGIQLAHVDWPNSFQFCILLVETEVL